MAVYQVILSWKEFCYLEPDLEGQQLHQTVVFYFTVTRNLARQAVSKTFANCSFQSP